MEQKNVRKKPRNCMKINTRDHRPGNAPCAAVSDTHRIGPGNDVQNAISLDPFVGMRVQYMEGSEKGIQEQIPRKGLRYGDTFFRKGNGDHMVFTNVVEDCGQTLQAGSWEVFRYHKSEVKIAVIPREYSNQEFLS